MRLSNFFFAWNFLLVMPFSSNILLSSFPSLSCVVSALVTTSGWLACLCWIPKSTYQIKPLQQKHHTSCFCCWWTLPFLFQIDVIVLGIASLVTWPRYILKEVFQLTVPVILVLFEFFWSSILEASSYSWVQCPIKFIWYLLYRWVVLPGAPRMCNNNETQPSLPIISLFHWYSTLYIGNPANCWVIRLSFNTCSYEDDSPQQTNFSLEKITLAD